MTVYPTQIVCFIIMFYLVRREITANISFASGVTKNRTFLNKMYEDLIKQKLENAISKHRGNGNASEDVLPTSIPEEDTNDSIQPLDPPLFSGYHSHGKNLLEFKLRENDVSDETDITKVNLWVHVWKKERKRRRTRTGQPKKSRKGKLIRIRVFDVKGDKRKGDKIAEYRTRIQKTKWFKISLPVSVIPETASNVNNTVLLRVECKRCNRKTKLVLPEIQKCRKRKRKRKNKKKNKKGRKPKPNCGTMRVANSVKRPFIVLEKRRKDIRSRRSLATECRAIANGTTYSGRCCKLSSFVNFSDLGLDDRIVIPSGYTTGSCLGRCPRSRHKGRRNRVQQNSPSHESNRSGSSHRRPKCKPAETSSLNVWLFNENHDLMRAELSGLIVNSCMCR